MLRTTEQEDGMGAKFSPDLRMVSFHYFQYCCRHDQLKTWERQHWQGEIIQLFRNIAVRSLYSLWQCPQQNKLVTLSKHCFHVWACEPLLPFHGQEPGWVENNVLKMLQWGTGRAAHTQTSPACWFSTSLHWYPCTIKTYTCILTSSYSH